MWPGINSPLSCHGVFAIFLSQIVFDKYAWKKWTSVKNQVQITSIIATTIDMNLICKSHIWYGEIMKSSNNSNNRIMISIVIIQLSWIMCSPHLLRHSHYRRQYKLHYAIFTAKSSIYKIVQNCYNISHGTLSTRAILSFSGR